MTTEISKRRPLTTLRWIIVLAGLLLPMLLLVPLGSLWLWQHGLLLAFAGLALLTTLSAYALQRWLLPEVPRHVQAAARAPRDDAGFTPQEARAFAEVERIAKAIEPDALQSREAALAVAAQVFAGVAAIMEPGKKEPLWQFTAPEALAATEQVSRRLREFIERSVPLGDRLTIAQLRALYAWRNTVEWAQSAYDLYRMLRFLNPAAALTNELREQLTRKLMAWGKDHVARQLTQRFVEEVGRAAIDLYGGRLRSVSPGVDRETNKDAAQRAARDAPSPLRVLIVGQTNVGKSSLVNALLGHQEAAVDAGPTTAKAQAYALQHADLPAMTLLDTAGGLLNNPAELKRAADSADLILWVVAANRADREADRAALAMLRAAFAAKPDHRPPAMLGVLTQVDRLRPFDQWSPPYDLTQPGTAKAASIAEARQTIAGDLEFAVEALVPLSLRADAPFNLEGVWSALAARLAEARATQLVRSLRRDEQSTDWSRLWSQTAGAGRSIVEAVWR